MRSLRQILYSEFAAGRSWFDWLFLLTGVLVQIVVFTIQPNNIVSVVSGIAGIISVILCAQGKISTFLFGFIQISTYLYLSLVERLYAEVGVNVFYFCSQCYAIFVWLRHYHTTESRSTELMPRCLGKRFALLIAILTLIASLVAGWLLQRYTDDSQPWLDAFTTIPALVAQILLMFAYREQWILWLIVDILSVIMWARAGNWCLFAQYLFWCVNCLYGWNNWSKKECINC